jgi:hypothetical protein
MREPPQRSSLQFIVSSTEYSGVQFQKSVFRAAYFALRYNAETLLKHRVTKGQGRERNGCKLGQDYLLGGYHNLRPDRGGGRRKLRVQR